MDTAKLTIRLRDERLYGLLKVLAAHRGVSMNRLVEDALARELELEATRTEQDLRDTLELLRSYRGGAAALARAFADAELDHPDPLRSDPLPGEDGAQASDPLGALTGFHGAA